MDLEGNKRLFREFPWSDGGNVWGRRWGGTEAQWYATIFPRIRNLVGMINYFLEIGCGHGRMTRLLVREFEPAFLVGVDILESCVRACEEWEDVAYSNRRRSGGLIPTCKFHVGDGKALPAEDESVAFVFSWDSLVHVDKEVMEAYLLECRRVLWPVGEDPDVTLRGRAFLHHSNLGVYPEGEVTEQYIRDPGVSAKWVRERVKAIDGLRVVSQEVVNWGGGDFLIDCFTVLERTDERPHPPSRLGGNPRFWQEAERAKHVAELYKA